MKIRKLSFNFITGPMDDLTLNKEEIINGLSKDLMDFKYTNLPSEAPRHLPRIVGLSKSGLFQVTMTNQNVLIESIDKVLKENPDFVVLSLLGELVEEVGTFFENYIDRPYNYCGITVVTEANNLELDGEPLEMVKKAVSVADAKQNIDNINYTVAYIEDNYYINLGFITERQISVMGEPDKKPKSVKYGDNRLVMQIDVNDKYGFINNPDYFSEVESAIKLVSDMTNFYNNKALEVIKNLKFVKFNN